MPTAASSAASSATLKLYDVAPNAGASSTSVTVTVTATVAVAAAPVVASTVRLALGVVS